MSSLGCPIDNCGLPLYRRQGVCNKHYQRRRKNGNYTIKPHANQFGPVKEPTDRFNKFIDKNGPVVNPDLGPCWVWKGYRNAGEYGVFGYKGTSVLAHRWAYEQFVGKIPEKLVIDHKCYNHPCCNPDHLEPVTSRVNTVDRGRTSYTSISAKKEFCKRGHPLSGDNVYYTANGAHRHCKACKYITNLAGLERLKQKEVEVA